MDCNCYYRIIVRFSSLLCIAPRFDFSNGKWINLRVDKCRATLLIVILIISTITSSIGQQTIIHTGVPKTIGFLLIIKSVTVFITNFNALHVLHFQKQEDCNKLFNLMMRFCTELKCTSKYECRKYYIFTFVYCLYLVALDTHELWFWTTAYNFMYGKLYLMEKIQCFYVYIISLFVYALLDNITWYWKMLNYLLIAKKKYCAYSMDEICGWFKLLCDINIIFNKIFGSHIFVMIITIVVYIVTPIHGIVVNADNQDSYFNVKTNMHMLTILLAQTITSLVVGITIIQKCEDIRNLTQETTTICYDIIYSVHKDSKINNQLNLLIQQISTRNVNISAAGYFTVDHSTLFSMMNIILSYLIILAQFHSQTN